LFLTRAADVRLCHGEGQVIALPRLAQHARRACDPFTACPHRHDIRVRLSTISAVGVRRVGCEVFIEQSLARDVVVHPDDIGRAGALLKSGKLSLRDADAAEPMPNRAVRT
jgi:hypothetical protein